MDDKSGEAMVNDARQSGRDDPAIGERAEDFGAGGQRTIDPDAAQERDVARDPKLEAAGVDPAAGSRGGEKADTP